MYQTELVIEDRPVLVPSFYSREMWWYSLLLLSSIEGLSNADFDYRLLNRRTCYCGFLQNALSIETHLLDDFVLLVRHSSLGTAYLYLSFRRVIFGGTILQNLIDYSVVEQLFVVNDLVTFVVVVHDSFPHHLGLE